MTQPRITIITPCRYQDQYLEQALCSVLDQGYPNLEYIVINAFSEDRNAQVIALYRHRIAQYIHPSDRGTAEALNHALSRATGDIIGILHADDLYLPGTLELVSRRMSTPASPWLVGCCLRIGDHDQMLGIFEPQESLNLTAYLMHNCEPLPTIACFYRRELFQKYGMFDSELNYAFDYEFVSRLLAKGENPVHLSCVVAAQREHDERHSATHPVDMGLEFIAVARRHVESLPLPERVKLWRNCDQRERIYAMARAEMLGDEARGYLWQRLLYRPWWLANPSLRQMLVHRGKTRPSGETLTSPSRQAA